MKIKLVLVFLYTMCVCSGWAQLVGAMKPNYEKIKADCNDSTSTYYYPTLLARLQANDTTLTLAEYRHLYFGYVFRKEYKPYGRFTDEDKLLKYYRSNALKEADYANIIQLSHAALHECPFDLRVLNFLGYVYNIKGDYSMGKILSAKFKGILSAILSSGDGLSEATAYHVISVSHEYVILNIYGFSITSQSLIGECDYLALEKNDNEIKGLYFNVSQLLSGDKTIFK